MTTTITIYDKFIENFGKKLIDFSTDTFNIILVTSDYTFVSTHENKAHIVGELVSGNGYTTGGQTLQNLTWAFASGKTRLDADNVVWTATGGALGPVTGAIIYDDTSVNDKLLCYIDFGGEQNILAGSDLKITFNTDGIISFTQA